METRVCAECGMSLPSGVTDVFCPACALRAALDRGKEPGEGTFLRWFRQLTGRKAEAESPEKPLASDESEWKESPPMATAAPAPGEVIGDYEILEKIGGNMGLVFRARHRLLDKVVALKLLPADWIADPARLARFQREMRVMAQLEHPNLVTAADARCVGDWHLVAMQLIDGVDLQQLVRTQGPLSIPVACEAARQTALGLQYAHEHGLIHRDIKPSNLMITRSGTIKVIDMGLALTGDETTAHLTQTGLVLGTMSYCAPEQFDDASSVDIRADIYSLGCTLYHLLTGKAPYSQRRTFGELVKAHQNEPFPILVNARPEAPASLEALLSRMIAKDREARFSTPSEVVEALEPFANGAELAPLVPAKTQQDFARPVASGKTPTPPQPGRPANHEEPPKARWTRRAALAGLGGALAGGVFLAANRRPARNSGVSASNAVASASGSVVPTSDPVVVLMDTTAAGGVYDEETRVRNGATNAEKLNEVLQEILPRRLLHDVALSSTWRGEDGVFALRPRLVVMHRSSFFHSFNAELELGLPPRFAKPADDPRWSALYEIADDKLISLIALIGSEVPGCKFLVYSRGTDERWLEDKFRDQWIKDIEARFPKLMDRVTTMVIPGRKAGTFKDRKTADEIRNRVKGILGLPEKTK